jgi:hypothetical protein
VSAGIFARTLVSGCCPIDRLLAAVELAQGDFVEDAQPSDAWL